MPSGKRQLGTRTWTPGPGGAGCRGALTLYWWIYFSSVSPISALLYATLQPGFVSVSAKMATSIPYDPSLILGAIVPEGILAHLSSVGSKQDALDAGLENLNS